MSPRRSYQDEVEGRLLEFWVRREEFGNPIGCVATTFTFDAGFFEEECLGRFVGMDTHPQEDGRVYLVEREEKLAEIFACVLVDRSHVVRERSLRWHLLPVRVPQGHILHAKVTLLVWQECIRVLVGSANVTEYGYRRNFEQIGVLDFTPTGGLPTSLLNQVLAFFRRVCTYTPGTENSEGPQAGLARFLEKVPLLATNWGSHEWRRGEPSVRFVPLFPDEKSLFQHLAAEWAGPGPSAAYVLSPFFDEGEQARRTVDGFLKIMAVRGEREIHFIAPGDELEDGTVEMEVPPPWKRIFAIQLPTRKAVRPKKLSGPLATSEKGLAQGVLYTTNCTVYSESFSRKSMDWKSVRGNE